MKYLKIAAIAAAYLLFVVKTDVFQQIACPVASVSVTCSPRLCSPESVLLTAPRRVMQPWGLWQTDLGLSISQKKLIGWHLYNIKAELFTEEALCREFRHEVEKETFT